MNKHKQGDGNQCSSTTARSGRCRLLEFSESAGVMKAVTDILVGGLVSAHYLKEEIHGRD